MAIKALLHRIFIVNWPRKLVAFLSALTIWFLVNGSITITRTFPDTVVRIVGLPPDKTVVGLLPHGILNKRVSVTLTGSRSVLEDLSPSDIEIVINAQDKKDSWMAHIEKKNIVSLNFDKDLQDQLKRVSGNDLFIQVSKLVTDEIPVMIQAIGDPPAGYQFLGVWPKELLQRVSGSAEEVYALKEKGLELTLQLSCITKPELDAAYEAMKGTKDEISLFVPDHWKQVAIPFRDNSLVMLNDPRADLLRIDFLKQELLPLGTKLPVTLYFPLKYSDQLNPQTISIQPSELIEQKNGIHLLGIPLFVRDVSRLFLEVVQGNLEISILAAPRKEKAVLDWSVTFVNPKSLEDAYVNAFLKASSQKYESERYQKNSEQLLRCRFQDYMSRFVLYTEPNKKLDLLPVLGLGSVNVQLGHSPR